MTSFARLIATDLQKIEDILGGSLITDHPLEAHVNFLCQRVVKAGGKRIRPAMVMLAAMSMPGFDDKLRHSSHLMAAAVELLHTATLIHDDVIDNSPLRRGKPTLNETEGNQAAVLAGDYLFTRCFNLLKELQSFQVMGAISETIATLVAGELQQMQTQGDLTLGEEDYAHTIYCKTGALFEVAASCPAVFTQADDALIQAYKAYGRATGAAFQIVDDNLDYAQDTDKLGKQAGEDLTDGRITLPVILALKKLSGADKDRFTAAIKAGDFEQVRQTIISCGALQESQAQAQAQLELSRKALSIIPDSPYKAALLELTQAAITRSK